MVDDQSFSGIRFHSRIRSGEASIVRASSVQRMTSSCLDKIVRSEACDHKRKLASPEILVELVNEDELEDDSDIPR